VFNGGVASAPAHPSAELNRPFGIKHVADDESLNKYSDIRYLLRKMHFFHQKGMHDVKP
jgi:hypothetical protein